MYRWRERETKSISEKRRETFSLSLDLVPFYI